MLLVTEAVSPPGTSKLGMLSKKDTKCVIENVLSGVDNVNVKKPALLGRCTSRKRRGVRGGEGGTQAPKDFVGANLAV